MADRNDRRRIPPPPGRAIQPPDIGDDDLDAAFGDLAPPDPSTRQQRDEFRAARRALVDLYSAASGGELDHTAFNGVSIDEMDTFAASHGVRGWVDLRDENAALRAALGQEVAGRHRLLHDDLADVLDPAQPFDADVVLARAAEISEQRAREASGLLVNAMAAAGIDTSGEDFDPVAVLRAAANPQPTEPASLPEGVYLSTPASRTANLPTGRPTNARRMVDDLADSNLTGIALIEAAAIRDIASGKIPT